MGHWPVSWEARASGNRWIFLVSSKTHFPLSVFVGKTGFELLSARRDQRRRRHGRKDPISKNLEKSSTFCEKSFMHRHFPATSWLPTAPSCTPNNPPCTPGAPWVDSDRRRWDSAFFGFPSFPPTRTPHPTTRALYVHSTTPLSAVGPLLDLPLDPPCFGGRKDDRRSHQQHFAGLFFYCIWLFLFSYTFSHEDTQHHRPTPHKPGEQNKNFGRLSCSRGGASI